MTCMAIFGSDAALCQVAARISHGGALSEFLPQIADDEFALASSARTSKRY